jgi:aminoglycoside phosphotransferase (APT) family kinase protein
MASLSCRIAPGLTRLRSEVHRYGMEPFVTGHAEPAERGFGLIAERCLGMPVTAVRELPAPASTSYAARRLMLDLADGRTLDVFVKDFGASPHAAGVALRRGARERYVYERVLAGQDLGTPELHGVVWEDEPGGRHWLLLEFVQGRTLRQSPIEDWIAAAGWLGRLHGTIAGREAELARPGLLLNYDVAYFRDMAKRALQAVGSRSGSLHRRLAAALDGYGAMIERVGSIRPTLVHGSYRPKNILVGTWATPVRICPIDWELAAVGPQLHDLACMANEVDHRPTIERFCEAYATAARASGLAVTWTGEMLAELDRLRLHRALRSLARSAEWAYPESAVTILVGKAETIRRGMD